MSVQFPPKMQSWLFAQKVRLGLPKHPFNAHGLKAPHCALFVQLAGADGLAVGKYCNPTPMPTDPASWKNDVNAPLTASHFVTPEDVASSIDPDVSSMMYMSRGTSVAVCVVAAHPPPTPPVPLLLTPLPVVNEMPPSPPPDMPAPAPPFPSELPPPSPVVAVPSVTVQEAATKTGKSTVRANDACFMPT